MTAIFVHSDTMAIGVLSALAAAGRQVPTDIAVASCGDVPFAEYLIPPLSSLRVPFEETGEQSVELLLRSIAGQPMPTETVLLPVELIVRGTDPTRARAAAPPLPRHRPTDQQFARELTTHSRNSAITP